MFQVCCNSKDDANADVPLQMVRRNGPMTSSRSPQRSQINFAPVPVNVDNPVDVMKLVNFH